MRVMPPACSEDASWAIRARSSVGSPPPLSTRSPRSTPPASSGAAVSATVGSVASGPSFSSDVEVV